MRPIALPLASSEAWQSRPAWLRLSRTPSAWVSVLHAALLFLAFSWVFFRLLGKRAASGKLTVAGQPWLLGSFHGP